MTWQVNKHFDLVSQIASCVKLDSEAMCTPKGQSRVLTSEPTLAGRRNEVLALDGRWPVAEAQLCIQYCHRP